LKVIITCAITFSALMIVSLARLFSLSEGPLRGLASGGAWLSSGEAKRGGPSSTVVASEQEAAESHQAAQSHQEVAV